MSRETEKTEIEGNGLNMAVVGTQAYKEKATPT